MHCALSRANMDVVKLLVEKGADQTLADEDGKKPPDLAKEAGKDFVKALKKK